MDDRMVRAIVHEREKGFSDGIARKDILLNDVLPSARINLPLEEPQEIGVLVDLCDLGFEVGLVGEEGDGFLVERGHGALGGEVVVVGGLELGWGCAEDESGEEIVDEVVVAVEVAEEDVEGVVVGLEEAVGEVEGGLGGRVGAVVVLAQGAGGDFDLGRHFSCKVVLFVDWDWDCLEAALFGGVEVLHTVVGCVYIPCLTYTCNSDMPPALLKSDARESSSCLGETEFVCFTAENRHVLF